MPEYGKPLWLIHPLEYKVRVRTDKKHGVADIPDGNSIAWESPLGDIAGYDTLTESLKKLGFIYSDHESENNHGFGDLKEWTLEPLNKDWKTDLLDFFRDFWDSEWGCNDGDPPETDPITHKGIEMHSDNRDIQAAICKKYNLGDPVPMAVRDFNATVAWLEQHMISEKPKNDSRGRHPNSLKNLKHFKPDPNKGAKK